MAKSQKRYLVLLVFGLLVIIAAGVWMVFGRKTQIYEKTETIFYKGIMPSEKVLDFPVDCNTLTGSVNL